MSGTREKRDRRDTHTANGWIRLNYRLALHVLVHTVVMGRGGRGAGGGNGSDEWMGLSSFEAV